MSNIIIIIIPKKNIGSQRRGLESEIRECWSTGKLAFCKNESGKRKKDKAAPYSRVQHFSSCVFDPDEASSFGFIPLAWWRSWKQMAGRYGLLKKLQFKDGCSDEINLPSRKQWWLRYVVAVKSWPWWFAAFYSGLQAEIWPSLA